MSEPMARTYPDIFSTYVKKHLAESYENGCNCELCRTFEIIERRAVMKLQLTPRVITGMGGTSPEPTSGG